MTNQRGFIQIPILIAIVVTAVLGGGAYVAYEVSKSPQEKFSQEITLSDEKTQATTTEDSIITEPNKETGIEESKEKIISTNEEDKEEDLISSLQKQVNDLTEQVNNKSQNENDSDKELASENSVVSLPNGAIVEMDSNGNILRYIQQPTTQPMETNSSQNSINTSNTAEPEEILIKNVIIAPTIITAKIEWETSSPTESKIFLSGGNLSSKVHQSESGLSTRHSVSVSGLSGATNYSYEIEAISDGSAYKKAGNFVTENPPLPTFSINKEPVLPTSSWPGWNYFKVNAEHGNFVIEALTLEVSNPDEEIGSKTKVGEVQWRTLDKQGWNYRTCDAINSAFMSWQNKSYPYPCPQSSNPLYLTYANPDWQENEVNLTINPSITFPPGIEVYYYKVTDTDTGTVFEYQK